MRGNKDFLPTIQAYYRSVSQCELGIGKGPLLFAIMRGKVSEGLDFADNRARGVITVSQQRDTVKWKVLSIRFKSHYSLFPMLKLLMLASATTSSVIQCERVKQFGFISLLYSCYTFRLVYLIPISMTSKWV
jgi:hypothetical protein